jgi:hypothetical protein
MVLRTATKDENVPRTSMARMLLAYNDWSLG